MYVDAIFILQACLTLVPVHIMSGTKPMSTVDTHKQHPEILLSSIASRIRTIHEVFECSKSYPSDEIIISLKYLGCCEAADVVVGNNLGTTCVDAAEAIYGCDLESSGCKSFLNTRSAETRQVRACCCHRWEVINRVWFETCDAVLKPRGYGALVLFGWLFGRIET